MRYILLTLIIFFSLSSFAANLYLGAMGGFLRMEDPPESNKIGFGVDLGIRGNPGDYEVSLESFYRNSRLKRELQDTGLTRTHIGGIGLRVRPDHVDFRILQMWSIKAGYSLIYFDAEARKYNNAPYWGLGVGIWEESFSLFMEGTIYKVMKYDVEDIAGADIGLRIYF